MATPWTWSTTLTANAKLSSVSPNTILDEINTNLNTLKTNAQIVSFTTRNSYQSGKKNSVHMQYIYEMAEDISALKSTNCSSANSGRNVTVNGDYGHCNSQNTGVETSNFEDHFSSLDDPYYVCQGGHFSSFDFTDYNRVYNGNSV